MLDTIPEPLLDRFETIRLSGYMRDEKIAIAQKYLWPRARKDTGLKTSQASVDKAALREIVRGYAREAGVRSLQKYLEKMARKVAVELSTTETERMRITKEDVPKMLGLAKFTSDRFYSRPQKGVVMGLAWTSMGGGTLYIETAAEPMGKAKAAGSLKLTGMMGDVMKESAQISYTFAKVHGQDITRALLRRSADGALPKRISAEATKKFFDQATLHMHIPEGATPKDGPSAGVTMVTSLMSAALGVPVVKDLAMTGELTLTGRVLPIVGVKEKLIAARRSGVRTVVLPDDNRRDFDELDDTLKEGFAVFFAKEFADVCDVAFGVRTEDSADYFWKSAHAKAE